MEKEKIMDNQSSESKRSELKQEDIYKYKGIGGWLILVVIYLFRQEVGYIQIMSESVFAFGGIVLALFLATAYLIYLFFKKNIKFPKYFYIFLITQAVMFTLFVIFLGFSIIKLIDIFISLFILISYINKSKRVKATFVEN